MIKPVILNTVIMMGACGAASFAQTAAARDRFNLSLPSPTPTKSASAQVASKIVRSGSVSGSSEKIISDKGILPTEIYRVAPGDTIHINVQNSVNASGYYSVRRDGTVGFSLAGDNIAVAGLTASEIATTLRSKITLYRDPKVQVRVQEYGSHIITVKGLVERSGNRSIQREAVPLFVICADALLSHLTSKVVIRAADGTVRSFTLKDPKIDSVLIYPGDEVEFVK